jgi:hypothetical protein
MLYELRTYTLVPGGLREYLKLYEASGKQVQINILGQLVVLMQPESGDLNQLIFVWGFENFEDRKVRRQRLMADEAFAAFRKSVRHLLIQQESQLLSPA